MNRCISKFNNFALRFSTIVYCNFPRYIIVERLESTSRDCVESDGTLLFLFRQIGTVLSQVRHVAAYFARSALGIQPFWIVWTLLRYVALLTAYETTRESEFLFLRDPALEVRVLSRAALETYSRCRFLLANLGTVRQIVTGLATVEANLLPHPRQRLLRSSALKLHRPVDLRLWNSLKVKQ